MRLISFALTTEQVRARSKTVTRRLGWRKLTPGTLLQPVVKAQGLKKGERVEKIGGPIRVVSVRRETLSTVTGADVVREGFHGMDALQFALMFCRHNGCELASEVTRIEFEYIDAPSVSEGR